MIRTELNEKIVDDLNDAIFKLEPDDRTIVIHHIHNILARYCKSCGLPGHYNEYDDDCPHNHIKEGFH